MNEPKDLRGCLESDRDGSYAVDLIRSLVAASHRYRDAAAMPIAAAFMTAADVIEQRGPALRRSQ